MNRQADWSNLKALGGAVCVTVLLVWFLGVLNASVTTQDTVLPPLSMVQIRGPQNDAQLTHDEEHEPEPQPDEPMEVNLDTPKLEPMPMEPLDIDMTVPTTSVIPIQVSMKEPTPQKRSPPPSRPSPPAKPAVHRADQVDQPPRESARNPSPVYPPQHRQLGIEGKVVVRLLIDESGRVQDVKPVRGDDAFVKAVLDVALRWRFQPAINSGKPVKVWGVKEVQFRIRGR